jgi:NAD(P)-dependent dehydrogenase (short-subunit alcohol dehydrogenase family)
VTKPIFENQIVVVTGASRGIGRGCAEAFAAAGAEVVLVARNRDELESLAALIRSSGGKARATPCDMTSAHDVQRLFAGLERCDVLVNNAGTNRPQSFLDVDLATLDEILALNVRSMFVTAQAAARLMVKGQSERKGGAIVNMSSQMGHVGGLRRSVYCMSKHAIEGLTKAMALDLAPEGVRVNSVAPTFIETPMTKPYFEDASFKEETLRKIPLGRLGTVAEVVAAIVFLASPAASLITGTSLVVDGGYTAQ